jgi:AraC-like DNA-binding protein
MFGGCQKLSAEPCRGKGNKAMIEQSRPQKESVAHGDLFLPLMVHDFTTDPALAERIGAHWHAEYEFFAVMQGEGEFRIDDRRFPVRAGELMFVNADAIHGLSAQPGVPLSICAVVFDRAMIDSSANDVIQQNYIQPLATGALRFREHLCGAEPWEREAMEKLKDIRCCFAARPACFELRIKADLYLLWYLFAAHPAGGAAQPRPAAARDVVLTKRMVEYLRQNYAARLTLSGIAREFHLSEGQLCRFFKARVNLSIVEYLNYYRISRATELLVRSDAPVGEIAGCTGFDTISYFNKIFRRYMHCTPGAFRRAQRGQAAERAGET